MTWEEILRFIYSPKFQLRYSKESTAGTYWAVWMQTTTSHPITLTSIFNLLSLFWKSKKAYEITLPSVFVSVCVCPSVCIPPNF
jgi:hypothetical protein